LAACKGCWWFVKAVDSWQFAADGWRFEKLLAVTAGDGCKWWLPSLTF